jgi:hypothetical protein
MSASAAPNLPQWTRVEVIARLETVIPESLRPAALFELDRYEGLTAAGRARVQLAILSRAGGDIRRIKAYVDSALGLAGDITKGSA